jgi:hypothetical protein
MKKKLTLIAIAALFTVNVWGQDINTFPLDNKVGIGTTNPSYNLEVKSYGLGTINTATRGSLGSLISFTYEDADGDGSFWLRDKSNNTNVYLNSLGNSYFNGGNVGIGITTPTYKLDVQAASDNSATIMSRDAAGGLASYMWVNSDGSGSFYARSSDNTTNGVAIQGKGNSYLNGGNVGIGTTSPLTKLHIEGNGGVPAADYEILKSESSFILSSVTSVTNGGLYTTTRLFAGIGSSDYTWFQAYNNSSNMAKDIILNPVGGNVGIGITSPSFKLDVQAESDENATIVSRDAAGGLASFMWVNGDGSGSFYARSSDNNTNAVVINGEGNSYLNGGNVGIGISSPLTKFHIEGNGGVPAADFETLKTESSLILSSVTSVPNGGLYTTTRLFAGIGSSDYTWLQAFNSSVAKDIILNPVGGNVGIGTTAPTYKLSVKGTIGCGEVIVEDVTGWPDFVFEPTYNLMPLSELNTYIQEHKHLPEIPTTAEVEENGISVGEMNAKLLQKIEELTLYVIEQDKKIDRVLEENQILKKQIDNVIKSNN